MKNIRKRGRKMSNLVVKKKRRLTDLDAVDEDDASDEDFINTRSDSWKISLQLTKHVYVLVVVNLG